MNPGIIKYVAGSKDVALILSLAFNVTACTAIWRLWKSREMLQDKVTAMLTELVKELSKVLDDRLESLSHKG